MRISSALVFDPTNNVNGQVRDIFISGGKIVDKAEGEAIDGSNMIAMAGGIDIHSHIYSACKGARFFSHLPESFFNPEALAKLYLSLGYTAFVEPGISEEELAKTEKLSIDSFFLRSETDNSLLLKGFLGKKYLGEKGMELFLDSDDDLISHIHLSSLAKGDSLRTLKDFLSKLGGRRCHLSHIAYYIYEGKGEAMFPRAKEAAELLAKHKNVTFDVGPVSFDRTFSLTADDELLKRISKVTKREPMQVEGTQYQSMEYNMDKKCYTDSLFWLAGMELLLRLEDLSQASLSIDFPSGGLITGYPEVVACLMFKEHRDAFAKTLNEKALKCSSLLECEKEFSFYEIAQITRSSPAAACGFKDRGHLGIGAVGDVVLYKSAIGAPLSPAVVIKDGLTAHLAGERLDR